MKSAPGHPTQTRLLETVVALLDEHPAEGLTVDLILSRSGVSKGSLYHHYADLADLIETALTHLFTESVNANIAVLSDVVLNSATPQECYERLREVTRLTQDRALFPVRARRAGVLAMCVRNPRLLEKVAAIQTKLTCAYTDLFTILQKRNWMSRDFDPHAASIMIQAYTVGKIVDDISSAPVDPSHWTALIDAILAKVFGMTPPP